MPLPLDFSLPGRVVSFVGGGGKTTLLCHLAERYAAQGRKVLAATTTRIYQPNPKYYAATVQEAEDKWRSGSFAVIGTPVGEKLSFPSQDLWNPLSSQADLILLEADGAKGFPAKVPRDREPVILPKSDAVIAVLGLSALGQPLQDCCFSPETVCAFLGASPEHLLTETDAARILISPEGSRKNAGHRPYSVILNQCDTPERRTSGEKITTLLRNLGISQVTLSAFSEEERAYYQTISQRKSPL